MELASWRTDPGVLAGNVWLMAEEYKERTRRHQPGKVAGARATHQCRSRQRDCSIRQPASRANSLKGFFPSRDSLVQTTIENKITR
jgi:hypothetical protein